MIEIISSQSLTAFFQVVMIDLVLAGDNAIVIGLAAAGLPEGQRKKAILIGIFAATILRIGFASVTVQLLQIIGLLLAGGVLLLWVCWKMWRELRTAQHHPKSQESVGRKHDRCGSHGSPPKDAPPGGMADHDRRCVDVARQCLGRRRCRARASVHPDIRPGTVDCTDGPRRELHCPALAKAPLDRLCRPRDHPLCGVRHVLPRRGGAVAPLDVNVSRTEMSTFKSALIGIGESAPNSRQIVSNVRGKPWLPPF